MNRSQAMSDRVGFVDSMGAVTFDADEERFRATYDSDRDSPSLAAVAVVAAALERDPLGLETLYSVIDTDALEELVTASANGRSDRVGITFPYEGLEVTASSGEVIAGETET